MPRIQLPTDERIPEASRAAVDGIRTQLGFLPNVVKLMSVSPAVLNGWLGLQAALSGRLDRKTREAIALVVSEVNGCAYCLATHSRAATSGATPPDEIERNRAGTSSDAAVAAAAKFAGRLIEERGHVADDDVKALRAAGYSDAQTLEIVAFAIQFMFTNFVNTVAGTEMDFPNFHSDHAD
jgi:uncharacterized peroxidase-related enzyme